MAALPVSVASEPGSDRWGEAPRGASCHWHPLCCIVARGFWVAIHCIRRVTGPREMGEAHMTRRTLTAVLGALLSSAIATSSWAAEDEKRIVNGPSKTSFGGLELVLGQGASVETAFQPDCEQAGRQDTRRRGAHRHVGQEPDPGGEHRGSRRDPPAQRTGDRRGAGEGRDRRPRPRGRPGQHHDPAVRHGPDRAGSGQDRRTPRQRRVQLVSSAVRPRPDRPDHWTHHSSLLQPGQLESYPALGDRARPSAALGTNPTRVAAARSQSDGGGASCARRGCSAHATRSLRYGLDWCSSRSRDLPARRRPRGIRARPLPATALTRAVSRVRRQHPPDA